MKAEVWRRDAPNTVYDEFSDKPFIDAADGSVYEVRFMHTDDPFFFDARDRKQVTPPTVEEEIAFDEETREQGLVHLSLNEWLLKKPYATKMPNIADIPIVD